MLRLYSRRSKRATRPGPGRCCAMRGKVRPEVRPTSIRTLARQLRLEPLQRLDLLHRHDDAEADVVRVGHPPDALRPLRIAAKPVALGEAAGAAAQVLGLIDPRAAAGEVGVALVDRHEDRLQS